MGRDIISLDDLTVNNVGILRRITEVTLPTTYPDLWFESALNQDQLVKIAYFSELPVGIIRAKSFHTSTNDKIDTFEGTQKFSISTEIPNAIYLEVFAVLESYRGLGIGTKLLNYLVEETKKRFVHEIILHVHVENKDAISWYLKHGFEQKGEVKDYYKEQKLQNPDALILSLKV